MIDLCKLESDVKLLVEISNGIGNASIEIEIFSMVYPSGLSGIVRDMAWIQENICPIVGVAGGLAFILIIVCQAAIIIRHKRHGCQDLTDSRVTIKL